MDIETMEYETFIEALHWKYCDNVPLKAIEFTGRKTTQVFNAELLRKTRNKQSDLTILSNINLSSMSIRRRGEMMDGEMIQLSGAIFLDLSFNRIDRWLTVADIVRLTPNLRELILTGNPLAVPDDEECKQIGDTFAKITTIRLSTSHYNWTHVIQCLRLLPNIKMLNLVANDIETISKPLGDCWHQLRSIILDNNPIKDWNQVCQLGELKQLETLELQSCKLTEIRFEDCDYQGKTALFPSLKSLEMGNNQICDWRSVAELNKLRSLQKLVLRKNPLYDANEYAYNFNVVLARIENLTKLERESVKKATRDDAEKYYLRVVYPAYLEASTNASTKLNFFNENPTFEKLLKEYGEPVIAKKIDKAEYIKQNYLNLNICDNANPDESKRKLCKQFPISIKVSNLKFILRRLLNIRMGQDFGLEIVSKAYHESMEDRFDVNKYRIDDDHVINVIRF